MSSHTVAEPRLSNKFERYLRIGFRLLCWSLCLLYLYGILYLVFTPDESNQEDSKTAWCEEYHSQLTYDECADVAGW